MKGKIILALSAAIIIGTMLAVYQADSSDQTLYTEWKQKLGVSFSHQEEIYRSRVFAENVAKINEHNSKVGVTHKLGLNQFIFITQDEFSAQYLSTFEAPEEIISLGEQVIPNGPVIDWVTYGAVSPVSNQGQCTATYAFSAIGAVEGLSVIFYQKQLQYSVQQMIDCTQSYGNSGCASGTMEACFSFIKDKGVADASAYPYAGYASACKTSGGFFRVGNYTSVRDCISLANSLSTRPISVVVDGHNFQFYTAGIFSNCGTSLSLGALLVGMNDYSWNVKLSWGTNWGEKGYIRLSRGNTCGICSFASYPNTV